MTAQIYENEFNSGVIEYKGRPICKISKIQVTKVEFEPNGIKHIFVRKVYQNNNLEEHDEIDTDLIKIFNDDDYFTVFCYEGNDSRNYICRFAEKPPKGDCIRSAEVI